MPDMSAATAIRKAKGLIDSFGWPTYSPWQVLHVVEKTMQDKIGGNPQAALMWMICTREASKRVRRAPEITMLHPVRYVHVQDGQTKAGIDEFMLDCAEAAEHHPLNKGA